jgi:hypothetical protein
MVRRFTIACGFATLAILLALTRQGQTISGAQPSGPGAVQVTVIPDTRALRPPVKLLPAPPIKALPRAPRTEPLYGAPVHRGAGAGADRR